MRPTAGKQGESMLVIAVALLTISHKFSAVTVTYMYTRNVQFVQCSAWYNNYVGQCDASSV